MNTKRIEQLDDATLREDLHRLIAQDRTRTAELIAHIAEFDGRRLYLAEAFPSMFAYCVGEFRLSEGAAYKRIHAARTARRFPRLFDDIAEGRLHLTAVCVLSQHLTPENADELIAAATHRSKAEIESWLASRSKAPAEAAPAPRARVTRVAPAQPKEKEKVADQLVPGRVDLPLLPESGDAEPEVEPVIPQYVVHIPVSEETYQLLRRAQNLLGHTVPSGDLAGVLDRALHVLIERLEARKHAVVKHPRPSRSISKGSRSIPAAVRRTVWKRDAGQCTFTGPSGRRCDARRGLEYDHIVPFARGGESTVEGLRMRCRAHNQYEANQAFGAEFMQVKRAGAVTTSPRGFTDA